LFKEIKTGPSNDDTAGVATAPQHQHRDAKAPIMKRISRLVKVREKYRETVL